jgi:RNA polymerase sigma-70 factor (ECF subfamily)
LPNEREVQFERLFRSEADAVRSYALRRADPADADDVVAETFLVAWRRFDDMPVDPRPWLLSVARKVLANRRRSDRRQVSLSDRLARGAGRTESADDGMTAIDLRLMVLAALDRLPEKEQEAMRLIAWDRLSAADAATALGCTRATLAVRVHRARRRLGTLLDPEREATTESAPSGPPIRIVEER